MSLMLLTSVRLVTTASFHTSCRNWLVQVASLATGERELLVNHMEGHRRGLHQLGS